MADLALQQSPLAKILRRGLRSAQSASPGVCLTEKFSGYLNLRAREAFRSIERIEGLSGLRLPLEPNRFTESDRAIALWLGPDEWLLVVPCGTEHSVAQTLRQAGHRHFIAVTDVSHGYTTVNISGSRATDTLSKGCSLDLHPSVFRNNCCAQTLLAKAGVVIRRVDGMRSFDLIVRRSFAEYLVLWLQDAGAEYVIEVL
jgi:sarcosine oxidase, subunit gamma